MTENWLTQSCIIDLEFCNANGTLSLTAVHRYNKKKEDKMSMTNRDAYLAENK